MLRKIMMLALLGAGTALFAGGPSGKYKADKKDKNCPPLYSEVEFKANGTWSAQYGVGGTWKMKGGKLVIQNTGTNMDIPAKMAGNKVMMPTPADKNKLCTLVK
jgi:hypothetical protein